MPLAETRGGCGRRLVARPVWGRASTPIPSDGRASVMLYNSKVTPPEDGEAAGYLAQGDVLCAQFAHQLRWARGAR